jgi:LysM repeat protein
MMPIVRLAAIFSLLIATAPAQDAARLTEELRELRKTVEQQSKQIEVLTKQVAKLAAAVEGKPAAAAATEPAPGAPAAAKEEFTTANAPKAEPAQPHHIVVKGETLTSIAKHYNLPLSELMKANKGLDERKIQIGQSILLPETPQTKPSQPKPNP